MNDAEVVIRVAFLNWYWEYYGDQVDWHEAEEIHTNLASLCTQMRQLVRRFVRTFPTSIQNRFATLALIKKMLGGRDSVHAAKLFGAMRSDNKMLLTGSALLRYMRPSKVDWTPTDLDLFISLDLKPFGTYSHTAACVATGAITTLLCTPACTLTVRFACGIDSSCDKSSDKICFDETHDVTYEQMLEGYTGLAHGACTFKTRKKGCWSGIKLNVICAEFRVPTDAKKFAWANSYNFSPRECAWAFDGRQFYAPRSFVDPTDPKVEGPSLEIARPMDMLTMVVDQVLPGTWPCTGDQEISYRAFLHVLVSMPRTEHPPPEHAGWIARQEARGLERLKRYLERGYRVQVINGPLITGL